MKKVLIFRTELLSLSETFIKEQIISLSQWTPVLAGYRQIPKGLDLADVDIRILPGIDQGIYRRWWFRLCQWMGIAHTPTVHALRGVGADLVHVHFGTDAVDIWPSVRKLGSPTLITLHGYDINIYRKWWESGGGGVRRKRYPRQLLRLAREPSVHFIAVSKAIKERAIQFGIPPEKITVAYIGIDTNKFNLGPLPIANRRKRILFVGRLVEKKGPSYLVRAFARLSTCIPDVELIMIGSGPLRKELEHLATKLGVAPQFLGALTNEEVRQQMLCARVLCLPSITADNGDAEGLPIVILEALASGLPVITSARGGAGEAVKHGYNGLCFKERDLNDLCCHLSYLLSSPEITNMSSAARSSVDQNMAISDCSEHLENIYDTHVASSIEKMP
jgi:glycosyltransferase involved in cell wall biosynthesis